LSYVWADKGSRPPALKDLRYTWAYLFGRSAPSRRRRGPGVAVCKQQDDEPDLIEIARRLPWSSCLLVLDGAGWHQAAAAEGADNITLLHLPPTARADRWRTSGNICDKIGSATASSKLHRHRRRLLRGMMGSSTAQTKSAQSLTTMGKGQLMPPLVLVVSLHFAPHLRLAVLSTA